MIAGVPTHHWGGKALDGMIPQRLSINNRWCQECEREAGERDGWGEGGRYRIREWWAATLTAASRPAVTRTRPDSVRHTANRSPGVPWPTSASQTVRDELVVDPWSLLDSASHWGRKQHTDTAGHQREVLLVLLQTSRLLERKCPK